MVKVVIIAQNDFISAEIATAIQDVSRDFDIVASFYHSDSAIEYLLTRPSIDIIFAETKIDGGFSFKIFDHANPNIPVVFVTDDDGHMLRAFEYNCIAYLIKPIDPARLRKAITKYKMLYQLEHPNGFENRLVLNPQSVYTRHRIIVKKGIENISLPIANIVLFHTENRTAYVIDKNGNEFISYKNLCDIEGGLDRGMFFRVNRQYIVNVNFIHGYKPYEKVKLLIELTIPKLHHHMLVVSQEMAPQFRDWMHNG